MIKATDNSLLGIPCIVATGLLLLVGCNQVRKNASARSTAPGLREDSGRLRTAHNGADPNAPFSVLVPRPKLTERESLLDINEVTACQPSQLNLFESRARANGARHTLRLTIENDGSACRLGGYPSISLLGSNGVVLSAIRIRKVSESSMAASLLSPEGLSVKHDPPFAVAAAERPAANQEDSAEVASPRVLLPAKGEAAFELGWTSGPACLEASRIAVAAPGTSSGTAESVIISRALSVCEDQVMITAVAPAGTN